MKKNISNILILIAMLFCEKVEIFSQCPSHISINNQQDIDDFSIDHPDCVNQGWVQSLTINGSDISNLNGLNDIKSIRSVLTWQKANVSSFSTWTTLDTIHTIKVQDTDSILVNFTGLEGLDTIGTFDCFAPNINSLDAISNCKIDRIYFGSDSITTISGFNSIMEMTMIRIDNCPNLVSITGFQSLEHINQHFWIRWNNSLTDISGFQNLKQVQSQMNINSGLFNDLNDLPNLRFVGGTLILQNLTNLIDISLLSQFIYIGSIQLMNNQQLETCCIIRNLLRSVIIRNTGIIQNNKTNCNSLFEIFDFCQDSDSDGIEDVNDNCVNSPNQTQSDYDNDGVGDGCDNCPLISNSNQNDSDGNGIGDVCDNGNNNIGLFNELGDIYNSSNANGIIIKSINGTCFRLIINDLGDLETYNIPCP